MKKFLFLGALFLVCGCTTVDIPNYIQGRNPYVQRFYAPFDQVHQATRQAFEELGWPIEGESDPSVFETLAGANSGGNHQVMIYSDVRQTSLFIGTRYSRMNAYLRTAGDNQTEVELRYVTISSIPLKTFTSYRKNGFIERVFHHIAEKLK